MREIQLVHFFPYGLQYNLDITTLNFALEKIVKIHSLHYIFHIAQFERIVYDTFDQTLNNAWVFIMKLFHIFLTLIFLSDLD